MSLMWLASMPLTVYPEKQGTLSEDSFSHFPLVGWVFSLSPFADTCFPNQYCAQASINNRFKTPTNPTDASSVVMASENSTMKESQKVLTLATESSAMLKGIQEVVEASVGGGVPSSTTTGIETSVNGGSTPSHPMKRSKGKTDSAMDISDDEDQHFEEAQEDTN